MKILQEKVIFLGIKNDVNNWMQAMDILVFPSLWEGFGMVLIEAQAAGLPVLASNVVPSIIKINDNVSFLDLNENTNEDWNKEILNLLNATRSRTIREDDFCDYDINKQGKKILEFYEE